MEGTDKLIEDISRESGKPKEEISRLVEEKKDELSGLVSDEGAAYIVGRELGISLLKEGKRRLKVKNLAEGLRGIDFIGKILSISEVREWEKAGKKGRVMSLVLGDDTGSVRMPLWNEEIDAFQKAEFSEGDVVSVGGSWVRLDNRGNPELRLGKGGFRKSREKVKAVPVERAAGGFSAKRMGIGELAEGASAEIRGCIVQLYRRNPFFEVCPECGTKVFEEGGKKRCKDHGIVEPELRMVVSGVMDDGTGNVRAVFFRELAERLFGENVKGLKQIGERGKDILSVYEHFRGLGKDFIVRGRVKKSDFTGELEMVVNDLEEMDPRKEAERLLGEMGG